MAGIDRRTALGVGLGVVTALIADPCSTALAAIGDETKLAEGVIVKTLGEGPSIIPGFPKVRCARLRCSRDRVFLSRL